MIESLDIVPVDNVYLYVSKANNPTQWRWWKLDLPGYYLNAYNHRIEIKIKNYANEGGDFAFNSKIRDLPTNKTILSIIIDVGNDGYLCNYVTFSSTSGSEYYSARSKTHKNSYTHFGESRIAYFDTSISTLPKANLSDWGSITTTAGNLTTFNKGMSETNGLFVYPQLMLQLWTANQNAYTCRIQQIKYINGGNVCANLIAAKQKSTGKYGLYETNSGLFFDSVVSSDGTFASLNFLGQD